MIENTDMSGAFGLALGGGAAKGLAHIPVLEAMDDLGVKPAEIAGTSMGAIIGSLYAAGMSGAEIREFAIELFTRKRQLLKTLFLTNGRTWASLLNLVRPAIIDPVVLFETVLPEGRLKTFQDLRIPLKVVATDFYTQSQTVLDEGDVVQAVAASSSLPVLLTPVKIGGRVLIDGGFVNPTPFDVLADDGQLTIGVDVTGTAFAKEKEIPGVMETWIGSFSITLHSLVAAKLQVAQPDLLITPPVGLFNPMDFLKTEDILNAAEASREDFKRRFAALMER